MIEEAREVFRAIMWEIGLQGLQIDMIKWMDL
jgi:hypothetical protein